MRNSRPNSGHQPALKAKMRWDPNTVEPFRDARLYGAWSVRDKMSVRLNCFRLTVHVQRKGEADVKHVALISELLSPLLETSHCTCSRLCFYHTTFHVAG